MVNRFLDAGNDLGPEVSQHLKDNKSWQGSALFVPLPAWKEGNVWLADSTWNVSP